VGEPWVPPRLKQDLEREIHGAAELQEPHRVVQIDVVARGEDERALGVVPRALQLLVPPVLDPIHLGDVQSFEFRRRHRSPPFAVEDEVTRSLDLFVHYDVSDVPFLGGLR
jgi:hypothetical protein